MVGGGGGEWGVEEDLAVPLACLITLILSSLIACCHLKMQSLADSLIVNSATKAAIPLQRERRAGSVVMDVINLSL